MNPALPLKSTSAVELGGLSCIHIHVHIRVCVCIYIYIYIFFFLYWYAVEEKPPSDRAYRSIVIYEARLCVYEVVRRDYLIRVIYRGH